MATYQQGGRGHRALAALAFGPMRFDHLRDEACAVTTSPAKKAKFGFLTRAMRDDNLIQTGQGWYYEITDLGRDTFHRLERGEEVTIGPGVPNVRVFPSRQGASA